MSTYWDIGCMDCNVTLGLHSREEELQQIVFDADALACAAEAIPSLFISLDTYGICNEGSDRFEAVWFVTHKGHKIRARNEYGEWSGQCCERFTCEACGCESTCVLDIDHEGPHSKRLTPTAPIA